jgi:hypothetical protein
VNIILIEESEEKQGMSPNSKRLVLILDSLTLQMKAQIEIEDFDNEFDAESTNEISNQKYDNFDSNFPTFSK